MGKIVWIILVFAAGAMLPIQAGLNTRIGKEIQNHIPGFIITYEPDYRQLIAESWPQSIDDRIAKNDWKWKPAYNINNMTSDMLENMKQALKKG